METLESISYAAFDVSIDADETTMSDDCKANFKSSLSLVNTDCTETAVADSTWLTMDTDRW